jgi:hypothetical protein
MDMSTIVGWLLGGFATRIYAVAGGAWVALEALKPITTVAAAVTNATGIR